jgi:hypothetical protein
LPAATSVDDRMAIRGSGSDLGYRRIEAVDSDHATGHFISWLRPA